MPVKVTKYTCRFKCGARATGKIQDMVSHEDKYCYKNPENQTCATCINAIYDRDSEEFNVWHNRSCKIQAMADFIEEVHEDLVIGANNHVKPLWHCPNHNQNEEQVSTQYFINEVRTKIEAKKREALSHAETKLPF